MSADPICSACNGDGYQIVGTGYADEYGEEITDQEDCRQCVGKGTMDIIDRYEHLAKRFYRATGLMAPGKDDPFPSNYEERWRRWSEWLREEASR